MFSTSNQAYVFLSTVYAGFIIGFIYDCCRMVRKITKPGIWLTGVMDLLFWIVMGLLSFLVLFYVNDGEVRIYTIAGFGIGWALYALTLSPYIMKALTWIYRMLAKLINWVTNLLLWPFRMLKKVSVHLIRRIKRLAVKLIIRLKIQLSKTKIQNTKKLN